MNGKLGMAASLYNMLDGYGDAVDLCARHCVYGYNNTRGGHGGMFFNNFWTPVGAWAAGEKSFKHFMKGQTWWRELYRRSDGAFNQAGRGGVGVSYALHYVAPSQRLRILGAPKSAFGTNCPDYLSPAIEAHQRRDYEACENFIVEYKKQNAIPPDELPVVDHLLESVRILRASIEHDLAYTERMLKEDKYYYASLELPQLKGIVPPQDPRLKAIEEALNSPEAAGKLADQRRTMDGESKRRRDESRKTDSTQKSEDWTSVIPRNGNWQMKVVEHISHAPGDWTEPEFDDTSWDTATLPVSWTMYHTALFRGKFNVADKKSFDGLRVQGNFFQQQNVLVYLNGELVAKVDELDRGLGTTDIPFTDHALKLLKKGENTIAISSRHKRRWGAYRGTNKTAATMGYWADALKAETGK